MTTELLHRSWVEKYRPKSVKNVILPKKLRSYFDKIIETKYIPSMTLYSTSAGTGKTTLSRALCADCGITEPLYINASKDGNIDTVRDRVTNYVGVKSLADSFKIVILDEMEASSNAFQISLRAFIEQYAKHVSFILTTNNIAKLDDKLKSRCKVQDFNMTEKEVKDEMIPLIVKRLNGILKKENVEYQENVVVELANKKYPDIRAMISDLQNDYLKYGKITSDVSSDADLSEFYQLLIKKDTLNARKYLIEHGVNPEIVYSSIFRFFVPTLHPEVQNNVIVCLAKYAQWNSGSVDRELTLAACLVDVCKLLK